MTRICKLSASKSVDSIFFINCLSFLIGLTIQFTYIFCDYTFSLVLKITSNNSKRAENYITFLLSLSFLIEKT